VTPPSRLLQRPDAASTPTFLGDQQAMAERRPWQCMAGGLAPDVPAHGRRDGSVKREANGGRAVTCCRWHCDPLCRAHCRVLWRGPCVCTGHDSPRRPFRPHRRPAPHFPESEVGDSPPPLIPMSSRQIGSCAAPSSFCLKMPISRQPRNQAKSGHLISLDQCP